MLSYIHTINFNSVSKEHYDVIKVMLNKCTSITTYETYFINNNINISISISIIELLILYHYNIITLWN